MNALSIRELTAGERATAAEVFGAALDPEPVRIAAIPFYNRPFVPGRRFGRDWMCWPRPAFRADFSVAPLRVQALFVHELVHVWQAQQGVELLFAKLKAGDGPAAYDYVRMTPADWGRMNIEQQASAVEHAFRLRRGGRAPWTQEAYAACLPFGRDDVQQA